MIVVNDVNEMPKSLSADLAQAVRIAFLAHRVEEPAETHPALLIRLVRRRRTAELGVGLTHLDGPDGDAVAALDAIRPEHLVNRQPGDRHVGAIVISDYARICRGDTGEDGPADGVSHGRVLVGAMLSRWSFEMFWPATGEQPECTIASPEEFEEHALALTRAAAALNDRFRTMSPVT